MLRGRRVDIARRIRQLLDERNEHAGALERVDAQLDEIRSAMGELSSAGGNGRRAAMAAAAPADEETDERPRTRQRFEITGDDMIVSLAQRRNGATTKQIKKRWERDGRGGTADNSLSRLVKLGRLIRTPIEGQRGSRYTVA